MNNSKQIEVVGKALQLEKLIKKLKNDLENLKSTCYKPAPNPPVMETVEKVYPPIVPKTKFNWLLAFIPSICSWLLALIPSYACHIIFTLLPIPWIIFCYFYFYKERKKKEVIKIQNSVQYKQQCSEVDKIYEQQVAEAKKRYEAEKIKYETEILPNYKKEFEVWNAQHNSEISKIEEELNKNRNDLENLYSTSKILPKKYHTIEALEYIYNFISTSEYDVERAIRDFECEQDRRQEQKSMMKK